MEKNVLLGKNIKHLRKKAHLGQQQLADNLGVSRSTLTCWENGIRTPKISKIVEIANFFGVNMDIIYKDLSKEK